jgi:hypothetical protein
MNNPGQGIDDTADLLPARLESLLRQGGNEATCLNISQPGWSTQSQIRILQRILRDGHRFSAVVVIYVLNDILSPERMPRDYLEARARVTSPGPLVEALTGRSFLASFLYHLGTTYREETFRRIPEIALAVYRRPEFFQSHRRELAMLAEICRANTLPLLAVTFPNAYPDWGGYVLGEVHPLLDRVWRELGVPHLDLLDALRRYPARDLAVWRFDTHPGPLAHGVAAAEVAPALLKLLSAGGPQGG